MGITTELPHASLERLKNNVYESDYYKQALLKLIDEAAKYNISFSVLDVDYWELLDKVEMCEDAKRYGIKFDVTNIDWKELENVICAWESKLAEAEALGIYWRENDHDPIGLQQTIDAHLEAERGYYRQNRSDYYSMVM